MSHEVIVYLGPARSGKTEELLRQYRDALRNARQGPARTTLWIAPTSRVAASVRERLIGNGLDTCLNPRVMTFDDLADTILASACSRLRRLSAGMERDLVRRAVRTVSEAKAFDLYANAAHREAFVDLLLEHIRELRRHGVQEKRYARIRPKFGNAAGQQELAACYTAYQQLLHDKRLVDVESAPWAACDVLASGAAPQFERLTLIVVDGFTDFTAAQHKLLSLLPPRSTQLLISLPIDTNAISRRTGHFSDQLELATAPNPRPDLFAKTTATLAELRRQHPKLVERYFASESTSWPAHDYLSAHIFRHPTQVPPPTHEVMQSLDHIAIIESAGAHDEIVQVARRIKRLLIPYTRTAGQAQAPSTIRPQDIVVVFRTLADAAPRVREIFAQFGIPYSLEASPKLLSTGLVKALLAVLNLHDEDWPFRRTVSVLTNNTLTAIDAPARQAADWLIRDLQIAKGRHALLERIGQLAADPTPPAELGDYARRRITAAKAALPVVHLLSQSLDNLPKEATPSEWCEQLQSLGKTLGLPPFATPAALLRTGHFSDQLPYQTPEDTSDALAWQGIRDHFASLERLDSWLGQPPRKIARHDLVAALLDVATHQSLPRQHDEVGRVQVLSAPTARNITARHLFLAGMSEQAFPLPERPGRLGSESEYRLLARAGQVGREESAPSLPSRMHDEMLLFYEVLSRAEDSMTISYPALDDKAQILQPSPYVVEIQRMLGAEKIPSGIQFSPPELSPIPQSEPPCSIADWRVQAVAKALDKNRDCTLLAGLFNSDPQRSLASNIAAGLHIVRDRAHGESFGPAEGILSSPAAAARFAERFGPAHLWSPSQWETYAACPYKFFLENVLRLEPLGDLTLEIDHRRRGSLVHDVLAKFHRKLRDMPQEERAHLLQQEADFTAAFTSMLHDVMRTTSRPHDGIDAALLELDRRQIEKWIARYREQHEKYDAAWTGLDAPMLPALFELRFGKARRGDAGTEDPGSIDNAFLIDIGGENVLVTGRIDRIDVGRSGGKTVFNIIDYKSGARPSLTSEKIGAGERLQPAIYVMAAEALIFGEQNATPLWAGYWSMKNGVTTSKNYSLHCSVDGAEPSDGWKELRPKVIDRIRTFVDAIRGGNFPVFSSDHDCTSRCEFNTICRVSQSRSLNKLPQHIQIQLICETQVSNVKK